MTANVLTLEGRDGARARIAVDRGFNCFELLLSARGELVDAIYAPTGFESGAERPSRGGIPILFPFPGRIPGTRFTWQGQTYELEPADAFGNAIHGFVMARSWRVLEQSETRAVGQFHAWGDAPDLRRRWPADFRITATYTLQPDSLTTEYHVENPGEAPLPCGLGLHPYFRVPLGSQDADNVVVRLPVSARWELVNMLPTGRRTELSPQDAAGYQRGQPFGRLTLDDVFSGLAFGPTGSCEASLADRASGRTLTIRFGRPFRECVVYTPPHREAICIEPYTCVPGPFDLAERGIDAGLMVLQPGESFTARVEYVLS